MERCERCVVQLALSPPDSCVNKVCNPTTCQPLGICGINARDCDELVACLKECPPP
jgi:hypothetical protein